ncbi:transposase [Pelosinus sp. IPA-1]|uniref:transposase n=1 Tax=Pelosinus sp. IPA-1 TaxID=3029569 RepID=UPI0024361C52|nr:transposase [Pelosinus sp. IPA-1]GMA98948.1 hypothetical protein PIPA1_17480 [Pelosinus sp. IPA-1]
MSRQARQKSQSGIYHIILRGINKQILFEEEEDREKFLECLRFYKESSNYIIYGYCLMDNHIHLLIKEGKESIGNTMKRIGVSYVSWYNRKYGRSGHLFQDRFKSEVVEDNEYLLTVLRYIHQNPLKSGNIKQLEKYKWSSYEEYLGQPKTVDTDLILKIFASKKEQAMIYFKNFMNEQNDDTCIDSIETKRMTDQEIKELIKKYASVNSPSELRNMDIMARNQVIRKIKEVEGVSTRQIARLIGISQSIVSKA